MKEAILEAVKKLTEERNGKPPGKDAFEKATGISEGQWLGKYWAKWSDAIREAGLEPQAMTSSLSGDFVLEHFCRLCLELGKVPSSAEIRLYTRRSKDSPSHNVFATKFGSKTGLIDAAKRYCADNGLYSSLISLLSEEQPKQPRAVTSPKRVAEGWVYLLQSGSYYKVGRSDNLERRIKQISIALPENVVLIHAIRTDDPAGIEAYWHSRFAHSRANGEWFKLTASDVAAFKRRQFQ